MGVPLKRIPQNPRLDRASNPGSKPGHMTWQSSALPIRYHATQQLKLTEKINLTQSRRSAGDSALDYKPGGRSTSVTLYVKNAEHVTLNT